MDSFRIAKNDEDSFGIRISGYLKPPKIGDYVFYLSSDDESELYISEDESKEKLDLIAFGKRGPSGIGNDRGQTTRGDCKNPSMISKPIHVEAGKRYAIKALLKADRSDPSLSVTWQMPGEEPPKQDAPPISGEYLEFEVARK